MSYTSLTSGTQEYHRAAYLLPVRTSTTTMKFTPFHDENIGLDGMTVQKPR